MRFSDALAARGLGAIAEFKRRSPSAGDLRPDADPAVLAAAFERAGAAAVSILVDERFAGSLDDLRSARAATALPLLGKGFFTEAVQLDELKAAGADAALLILRDLDFLERLHARLHRGIEIRGPLVFEITVRLDPRRMRRIADHPDDSACSLVYLDPAGVIAIARAGGSHD